MGDNDDFKRIAGGILTFFLIAGLISIIYDLFIGTSGFISTAVEKPDLLTISLAVIFFFSFMTIVFESDLFKSIRKAIKIKPAKLSNNLLTEYSLTINDVPTNTESNFVLKKVNPIKVDKIDWIAALKTAIIVAFIVVLVLLFANWAKIYS